MITKNEQYTKNMIEIMDEMQQYVPSIQRTSTVAAGDKEYQVEQDVVHPLLFGGDQLTVKNARAAQTAKSAEPLSLGRLEGLVPVFEDWHARLCLLNVSYSAICASLLMNLIHMHVLQNTYLFLGDMAAIVSQK